ncbi:MAG TPA: acetolactate decarboxylase [Aggregatilineaceae bacterium]|nr:acetolactate decarboxylase [Aggregatilineaceae bacterium]
MQPSSIYLCAPVNALVEGIYEENIPLSSIREHGDFGLGTFDQLDGEMVMLDGQVYQITGDGRVSKVDESTQTPFACVTFYQTHSSETLNQAMPWQAFLDWLLTLFPSQNIFYAIRVSGLFAHVRVRSVPKQYSYRPLVEVAQEQPEFEFHHVTGTLAGFFTPAFMASLNVPGLHLHFLSDDFQQGGHVLACTPQQVQVGIQFISRLELALPMTLDFLTWDFQRNTSQDLDQAEK